MKLSNFASQATLLTTISSLVFQPLTHSKETPPPKCGQIHQASLPWKDQERLFTFYDYPAMHWQHIRSTNPIESTFATIRHRSEQTKGCGPTEATLTMVFQLDKEAEKR
ncbi:MAG: hypothetical protein Tsb0015_12770 [Simkaniaceae bacterium]